MTSPQDPASPATDPPITLQRWREDIDGPLNLRNLRRKMTVGGWSVSAYTLAAGTVFARHVHRADKKDGVLSGEMTLTADGQTWRLGPGDVAFIPSGQVHSLGIADSAPAVCLEATSLIR